MLNLKNVTLFAFTGLDEEEHILSTVEALQNSTRGINFGSIKLFSPSSPTSFSGMEFIQIDPCITPEYSKFFVEDLVNFIDTDYCISIQWDGGIINPERWFDSFFEYDYIGAPWPNVSYFVNRVGNGGFSFRSKKFLEVSSELTYDPRHPSYEYAPEDWFLCVKNYGYLIQRGIKIPEAKFACNFSLEHPVPEKLYFRDIVDSYSSFGFHGVFNTGGMRVLHDGY